MATNVPSSRFGPDVTLASTDAAGRSAYGPGIAWDRVDRRRPVLTTLTVAPELGAIPGGGTTPERVLGPALVHAV